MNHQPFKEWLLSDEPLTAEQSRVLSEHLQGCASCSQLETGWSEVQALIQRRPEAAPAPGFTDRWQARLAARHLKKQRQQVWIALGLILLAAILLAGYLFLQASSVLRSPSQLLLLWISQLTNLYGTLYELREYLRFLFRVMPIVPITSVILAVGVLSFLSVSWVATFKQLITTRRIIR